MKVSEILETMEYGPAPESAATAVAWLEDHDRDFGLFINGGWLKPEGRSTMPATNPANGEELAQVTIAAANEVDAAVEAARAAYPGWAELTDHQRARHLYAIARGIQKHHRLLAVLESLDNGKPIRESRDLDVPLVARHFYYHAGWALSGRSFPGTFHCSCLPGRLRPRWRWATPSYLRRRLPRRSQPYFSPKSSPRQVYPPALSTSLPVMTTRASS
jgi:aldehyde dehydrogenase (NAD+)